MNIEETRAEFERWIDGMEMSPGVIQIAWEAWQESFKLGYTAAMHQIAQSAKP